MVDERLKDWYIISMKITSKEIAICAINLALMALSAQIYIPLSPPVTLQIAILLFICGYFGFKISVITVFCYLIAGIIGLPVFSGFQGGASVIFGATGGFLLSFLIFPFVFLLYKQNSVKKLIFCYLISLIACYLLGFLWITIYVKSISAIKWLIIFIPADVIKAIIAGIVTTKLNKIAK